MTGFRFDDDSKKDGQLPAGQRGIGCGLMILTPVISYVAAMELIKVTAIRNFFFRISPTLFGAPSIHPLLFEVRAIVPFLRLVQSWTDLEANLLLGLVILIILSGVIGLFYTVAYRAIAPNRYGRLDAPPQKRKAKRKSR